MPRSRVEDVLDVLNEMRYHFFRSGGSARVETLRQDAIELVARRELQSGRFKNRDSAEKSIHDACTRRLEQIQTIYDFDRTAAEWLTGQSNELRRAVASEIRTDRELLLAASFFGIVPKTTAV